MRGGHKTAFPLIQYRSGRSHPAQLERPKSLHRRGDAQRQRSMGGKKSDRRRVSFNKPRTISPQQVDRGTTRRNGGSFYHSEIQIPGCSTPGRVFVGQRRKGSWSISARYSISSTPIPSVPEMANEHAGRQERDLDCARSAIACVTTKPENSDRRGTHGEPSRSSRRTM